jgi:hypothetical protein
MYLADGGSSEWVQVDLSEVLLPLFTKVSFEVPDNLFDGHDVSLTPSLLHGVADHWW